jgi:hypothetical protein
LEKEDSEEGGYHGSRTEDIVFMNNHRAFLGSSPQGGYFDDFHYPKPIDT